MSDNAERHADDRCRHRHRHLPHHDIGAADEIAAEVPGAGRATEHFHHGDSAIPPRQGFGNYARTLLAGLGVPVMNRFGLRPAATASRTPEPIDLESLSRFWSNVLERPRRICR